MCIDRDRCHRPGGRVSLAQPRADLRHHGSAGRRADDRAETLRGAGAQCATADTAAAGRAPARRVGPSRRRISEIGGLRAGLRCVRATCQPGVRPADRRGDGRCPRGGRRLDRRVRRDATRPSVGRDPRLARHAHAYGRRGVGPTRRGVRRARIRQCAGRARVVAAGAWPWLPRCGPTVTARAVHRTSAGPRPAPERIS